MGEGVSELWITSRGISAEWVATGKYSMIQHKKTSFLYKDLNLIWRQISWATRSQRKRRQREQHQDKTGWGLKAVSLKIHRGQKLVTCKEEEKQGSCIVRVNSGKLESRAPQGPWEVMGGPDSSFPPSLAAKGTGQGTIKLPGCQS